MAVGAAWSPRTYSVLLFEPHSQIAAAIIPITTFVGLGLEHSVANMFFIPMAMKLGADITVRDFVVRLHGRHQTPLGDKPLSSTEPVDYISTTRSLHLTRGNTCAFQQRVLVPPCLARLAGVEAQWPACACRWATCCR
jgi:Formate/nitrite transporter